MDTASRAARILRGQAGAIAVFAMRGGSAFLAYVMLALIARHSTTGDYGHFAFIFSLTGFLGPLSALGQESVAFKYIPGFKPEFRRLAMINLRYLALGVGIFPAIGAVALTHSFEAATTSLLVAVAILIAASGMSEYLFAVQRAFGSLYRAMFAKEVLWRLVFIGLVGAQLLARPTDDIGASELSYFYLAALLCSLVMFGAFFTGRWAKTSPPSSPAPFAVTRVQVGVFFSLAFLTAASMQIDTLVLGLVTNGANLGAYFSAQRAMQLLQFFSYSFGMVVAPAVAAAAAGRDFSQIAHLSRRMSQYSGICVAIAAAVFVVEAPTILGIFNPAFRDQANVLRILCLGPLISSVCGMHYWVPTLCGLEREYLAWRLTALAVFCCLKVAIAMWGGILAFAFLSAVEMSAVALIGVVLARRRCGIWTF